MGGRAGSSPLREELGLGPHHRAWSRQGQQREVEAYWAQLWTVRDGKATRLEGFTNRAEALEAAGLSE